MPDGRPKRTKPANGGFLVFGGSKSLFNVSLHEKLRGSYPSDSDLNPPSDCPFDWCMAKGRETAAKVSICHKPKRTSHPESGLP